MVFNGCDNLSIDVYLLKIKKDWVIEMYWLGQSGVREKFDDEMIAKIEDSENTHAYKILDIQSVIEVIEDCTAHSEHFSYAGGPENDDLIEILSDEDARYQLIVE